MSEYSKTILLKKNNTARDKKVPNTNLRGVVAFPEKMTLYPGATVGTLITEEMIGKAVRLEIIGCIVYKGDGVYSFRKTGFVSLLLNDIDTTHDGTFKDIRAELNFYTAGFAD